MVKKLIEISIENPIGDWRKDWADQVLLVSYSHEVLSLCKVKKKSNFDHWSLEFNWFLSSTYAVIYKIYSRRDRDCGLDGLLKCENPQWTV